MKSIAIRQFLISRTTRPTLILWVSRWWKKKWDINFIASQTTSEIKLLPVLSYISVISLYFWTPGHKLPHYEVFSNFHTINPAKDERFTSEYYCPVSVTSGLVYLGKLLSLGLFNQKLTSEFWANLWVTAISCKTGLLPFVVLCWKFFPLLPWIAVNNNWTRFKP